MDNELNNLNEQLQQKIDYIKNLELINEGLRKYIKEMTGVYKIIEVLNSIKNIDTIYDIIIDLINDIIPIFAYSLSIFKDSENMELIRMKNIDIINKYKLYFKIDKKIYDWIIKKKHITIIPKPKEIKNNEIKNTSFAIAPIFSCNKVLGYLDIVIDKAEQRITQNEISILNLILKQFGIILENLKIIELEKNSLKKLKEIEELKNDILVTSSHELRTPLTILKGSAKIIQIKMEQDMWFDDDKQLYIELIKNVNKQIEILEEIVNSMFVAISIENSNFKLVKEKVNIKEIVNAIIKNYKQKYKKLNILFNCNLENPYIFVDEFAIKKVIENLLSNACKFSNDNNDVIINIEKNKENLLFSITDYGIGIEEENLNKIFEVFYRVDKSLTRKNGGLGIGLYITKKLIELHNGKIFIKSKKGEGTTVLFEIPQ